MAARSFLQLSLTDCGAARSRTDQDASYGFLTRDVDLCVEAEQADTVLAPKIPPNYATLPIRVKVLMLHALVHRLMDTCVLWNITVHPWARSRAGFCAH